MLADEDFLDTDGEFVEDRRDTLGDMEFRRHGEVVWQGLLIDLALEQTTLAIAAGRLAS